MTAYVVQSAQGTASTATGTVTLPAQTRQGNTLIAIASVLNSGTANAALTGVTLGGVADNFGHVADFGTATSPGRLYWWLDPLCAGGQTSVVFTTTGGNGTEALTMDVLEVGGMVPVPAGPGAADTFLAGTVTSGTTAWTTGGTVRTGWPVEIWTAAFVGNGTSTITGPGYPWISLAAQPNGGTLSVSNTLVGYQVTANAGTAVFSGTTAGSVSFVAAAVTFPALAAAPSLPGYNAGFGPQQGDMNSIFTSPLSFWQQRTVFRAAQLTTTTTLPSSGVLTTIGYDTIFEDPYQGWSTSTQSWTAPYTGWYHVTCSVSTGAASTNTLLTVEVNSPAPPSLSGSTCLVLPTTGGIAQGELYVLLVGGQDTVNIQALLTGAGSNVSTSNSPGSTVEIMWVAAA